MPEEAGSIFYTVDFRTKEVVNQVKNLDGQLDSLDSGFKKVDRTVKTTTDSTQRLGTEVNKTTQGIRRARDESEGAAGMLGRLGAAMAAYISIQAAINIIRTADAYGEMAERIQMATKDTAEYNEVQRRLLANANATYRPLAEAQELYVRTADTLRDMGYSTSQALDITDSLSLAFVRNAASGMRAESAISAVSKSLSTGKVAADQWESILAAVPTIIGDIAEATGRTTSEIRELGAAGKLTGDQLAEGLRKGHDANAQAAANMAVTVKDAYNNLINTLTVYIGTANEASGATGKLAAAVELFTKGFRFTVGMLEPHEKLNDLMRERAKLIDSITQADGTWRENMPGQVKAREDLKKLETEIKAIQDERVRQLKAESDLLAKQEATGGVKAPSGPDPETKKALDDMRQELELAKLTGEARARLQAIQKLGAEATKEEREEAEKLAAQIYKLEEAQRQAKGGRKKLTEAQREAKQAAEDLERAQEGDVETLARLSESLYQTTLNAEQLRDRQAELSLSKYATPDQIEEVKQLNRELSANRELLRRRDKFGDKDVRETIIGDVAPLSGGQFDEQTARYQAEAKAEDERYAAQQKRLQEALELQLVTKTDYQTLELEMYQAHSDRMLQIDRARQEMQLTEWANGFGQMSNDLQAFAQVFAQENSAMFQVAKASAIAQTIMQTYQGAQAAFTAMASIPYVGPALGIAAAAAAVAGGMARVAQIRSQNVTGGRLYGGPVAPDNMYRINENGAPEVFQAANGRQFMLPNTRGQVVSNDDATAANGSGYNGSSPVTINQTIQVTGTMDNRTSNQIAQASSRRQMQAQARLGGTR